jgi:hypothetical protein
MQDFSWSLPMHIYVLYKVGDYLFEQTLLVLLKQDI